jgi:hypothetical protein
MFRVGKCVFLRRSSTCWQSSPCNLYGEENSKRLDFDAGIDNTPQTYCGRELSKQLSVLYLASWSGNLLSRLGKSTVRLVKSRKSRGQLLATDIYVNVQGFVEKRCQSFEFFETGQ